MTNPTPCNVCSGRGFPNELIEFKPNPAGGWSKFVPGTNFTQFHYCKGSTQSIPTQGPNLIPQNQYNQPHVPPPNPYQQQPMTNGTPDEFRACTTCNNPVTWRPTGEYWPPNHPTKAYKPKFLPWNPDGTKHSHAKGTYGVSGQQVQGQYQQPQITEQQIQIIIAQTVASASVAFASTITSLVAKQDEIMAYIRGQVRQNADQGQNQEPQPETVHPIDADDDAI